MDWDAIKFKISSLFTDFKFGTYNLFYWFRVVWNLRPWDKWYIYKLMYHQIYEMNKYTAYDDYDEMKEIEAILKRLLDDDYHDMLFSDEYKNDREINAYQLRQRDIVRLSEIMKNNMEGFWY